MTNLDADVGRLALSAAAAATPDPGRERDPTMGGSGAGGVAARDAMDAGGTTDAIPPLLFPGMVCVCVLWSESRFAHGSLEMS